MKKNIFATIFSVLQVLAMAIIGFILRGNFITVVGSILVVAVVIALPVMAGVTNFESVHLRDTGGTATPVLKVDQRGTGKIVEFQDGGVNRVEAFDGGGVKVTAPTAVATGVPGFYIDTAGVSNSLEVRKSATPAFAINSGGRVSYNLAQALSITASYTITPTASYVILTSTQEVTSDTTLPIATSGIPTGTWLLLRNGNASSPINLDGTGGTVECKADIAMGASDVVELIFNGTAWNCIAVRDNS